MSMGSYLKKKHQHLEIRYIQEESTNVYELHHKKIARNDLKIVKDRNK